MIDMSRVWQIPLDESIGRVLSKPIEWASNALASADAGFHHGYGDARDDIGVDTKSKTLYGQSIGYDKNHHQKAKIRKDILDHTLGNIGYGIGRIHGTISGAFDKGLADRYKHRGIDTDREGPLGFKYGTKYNRYDEDGEEGSSFSGKRPKRNKAHHEAFHPSAWQIPIYESDDECCPECQDQNIVSLGVSKSNANNLSTIPINQFGDTMNRFIGDGDDPETYNKNIPALLAAKTTNSIPDPKVINNGINKLDRADRFKLVKFNRDDQGQNG